MGNRWTRWTRCSRPSEVRVGDAASRSSLQGCPCPRDGARQKRRLLLRHASILPTVIGALRRDCLRDPNRAIDSTDPRNGDVNVIYAGRRTWPDLEPGEIGRAACGTGVERCDRGALRIDNAHLDPGLRRSYLSRRQACNTEPEAADIFAISSASDGSFVANARYPCLRRSSIGWLSRHVDR